MNDAHIGGERGAKEQHSSAIGDHVVGLLREKRSEGLPEHVKKRLDLDLLQNKTADYSRVNLTEVFAMFGCDAVQTINHWRVAKILDGINFAARELKICDNIGPDQVVDKVYTPLGNGEAEKRSINVTVPDPDDPNKSETVAASLADMAYLLDVVGANRNLGTFKIDLRRVVFNYFTHKELFVEVGGLEEQDKKVVNILDQKANPKDDFADLDIKSYIKYINDADVQIGLQQMQGWVYTSDGHRELGGQAESVKKADGSGSMFIPLSGRMASERTLGELQKSDNGGMKGQPQEVGEMDEITGVTVRFRIADLEQRKRGGNIRNVSKSQRLAKAMGGLVSKENGSDNIHAEMVGSEQKKAIFLCGKDANGNPDGKIIAGIKNHYNKAAKAMRGFDLTSDEAADIAFTDVFAPCIINNENDWLEAMNQSFGMGKQGATSLINNKDSFGEHVLRIKCRNWDKADEGYPIEWLMFTGMTGDKGLRAYTAWRAGRGDIDQASAVRFADAELIDKNAEGEARFEEYIKNGIDEQEGSKIRELLEYILGDEGEELLDRYIAEGGEAEAFEFVIKHKGRANQKEKRTFKDYLDPLFSEKCKATDSRTRDLLSEIYGGLDIDWTDDEDVDPLAVIEGFLLTLQKLPRKEREKLKKKN